MPKLLTATVLTAALATGALAIAATPATAAPAKGTKFANCTALLKKYPAGVAKNKKAANKAVKAGHARPATSAKAKATYALNKGMLDRDKDGVACEQ